VSRAACRFGGIDVALLCAGIGERGDFLDALRSTEQLEKTLDIDLTAVIAGTRIVAQAMIAAGRGGRIISIASAAGAQLGWR
jgi:NAD(P)-dependent dehydrogenase (short-subunit alcohol dehydrogenase family)